MAKKFRVFTTLMKPLNEIDIEADTVDTFQKRALVFYNNPDPTKPWEVFIAINWKYVVRFGEFKNNE